MTVYNHAATGAAIALAVSNPVLAIVLSYLSHFPLDAVPHFGVAHPENVFERNKQKSFQMAGMAGTLLTIILLPVLIFSLRGGKSWWLLISCGVAAVGPDFAWLWRGIYELKTGIEKPKGIISKFHARIHTSIERPWLIALELAWFGLTLWFISKLK